MVRVYLVGISPKHQNDKSLIINPFRSLARYASHSGDIAFKEKHDQIARVHPQSAPSPNG